MEPSKDLDVLREEAEVLDSLNKVGVAIATEHLLENAVQVVTDAATRLSGAAFGAFFYNVVGEHGEAYTLYSLSGASREAFAGYPMPRNTAVFGPTFRGEGIVRSADITKDARYGRNDPYFGMPKGHLPVRSYLAVSVTSPAGEVLGGLFFGHPDADVFSARTERIVAAIGIQAGIAIEKARMYRAAQIEIGRRMEVEAALRHSEELLEAKVLERTAELTAANERLRQEAAKRENIENRFRLLVDGVVDYAIYMLDPNGIITNWNTGAQRIKGYAAAEVVGSHFRKFFTDEDRAAGLPEQALVTAATAGKYEAEGRRMRKNGSIFWASVVIDAIRDDTGTLLGFAKITRDVTERREASLALQRSQEQLAQAQKMEGIGHLTGGIAHDFNNLLAIIMGNIETLQRTLLKPNADVAHLGRSAENAMRGVQRAVSLTQRLLAFSRQQPLEPKTLNVSRLVTGMADLLRRSLGEQVVIETVLSGGLWQVHADPNQLEVAILNLSLNARDAMPGGGNLNIETANAFLDEAYSAMQVEVLAGQYVVISVSDNGSGMSREVAGRAFEPFFTTKDVGHGTGLGLSQVYGFVKQSGGHVKIYSEVGEGTTVKLYLPRWHATEDATDIVDRAVPIRGDASETILVVEDEPDVRLQTTDMLRELGYAVVEADTGAAALQQLRSHPEVTLIFTDVGLPGGMNGRQLADEARRQYPTLKILFTTGYARNAIVHHGRLDPGVQLLTKPFTYAGLAAKVRDMLDAQVQGNRVLFVDDEPLIQAAVAELLNQAGFQVETAATANAAMTALKLFDGNFRAAIVDIGLPDRGGDVLIEEIRALFPRLRIVVASGQQESAMRGRFKDLDRIDIITKPYGIDRLLQAIGGE